MHTCMRIRKHTQAHTHKYTNTQTYAHRHKCTKMHVLAHMNAHTHAHTLHFRTCKTICHPFTCCPLQCCRVPYHFVSGIKEGLIIKPVCPLIVCINARSGGRDGPDLALALSRCLGRAQVRTCKDYLSASTCQ